MSWHRCHVNMVGKKVFGTRRKLFVGMIWEEGWNWMDRIIVPRQIGRIVDLGCLAIQMASVIEKWEHKRQKNTTLFCDLHL